MYLVTCVLELRDISVRKTDQFFAFSINFLEMFCSALSSSFSYLSSKILFAIQLSVNAFEIYVCKTSTSKLSTISNFFVLYRVFLSGLYFGTFVCRTFVPATFFVTPKFSRYLRSQTVPIDLIDLYRLFSRFFYFAQNAFEQ